MSKHSCSGVKIICMILQSSSCRCPTSAVSFERDKIVEAVHLDLRDDTCCSGGIGGKVPKKNTGADSEVSAVRVVLRQDAAVTQLLHELWRRWERRGEVRKCRDVSNTTKKHGLE